MRQTVDPRDLGMVIFVLCWARGWSRRELARESGIDRGLIGDYIHGRVRPSSRTLSRIAWALGVESSFIEDLIPPCRSLRLAIEAAMSSGGVTLPMSGTTAAEWSTSILADALEAVSPHHLQLLQIDRGAQPRGEDRLWAEPVWQRITGLSEGEQRFAIDVLLGDERSWALAERLCAASVAAARHDSDSAMRLAKLAVRLAEAVPGEESWCLCVRGYCELFVANAFRVGGNLPMAGDTFSHAERLWEQGNGDEAPGLLDRTRRFDLKASLLKYQGRFAEALSLLDQALAGVGADPLRGRLLVKKATVLEFAGRYDEAITALSQAMSLIEASQEPRLRWALQFNLAVSYCHLDRYQEAEAILPALDGKTDLGNELDSIRLLWLQGRTWAGLGRAAEAAEALAQVRQHFLGKEIAYDFALVTLELATLYLEQDQSRRVQEMAEEMLWIFQGQRVHKEALAALTLFCQAAKKEKAQVGWTRRLIKYLYRAQCNRGLRFEA